MSAVDLELTLRAAGSHYAVTLSCTPMASSAPIDTSATPALIAIDQRRLRALALDPAAYGRALGQMLLADPLLARLTAQARAIAQQRNVPVRLRLTLAPDAAQLHTLRWETLRDPASPDAPLLTIGAQVAFSRYLSSTDWQTVGLRPAGPQRALVVIACPSDLADYQLAPVDVAAERLLIESSLAPLPTTVLAQGQATPDALTEHLRDGCDILYLLAHGRTDETGETWLYLEGADGLTRAVRGSELASRIAELRVRPQLIILGSCESAGDGHGAALLALGPQLAQVGVGAVLAMQSRITLETLRRFLPACLRAFQADGQIDAAVALARGVVRERPDFWVPVLFLRLPTGRLWGSPAETSLQQQIEERLHTARAALRLLLVQVQAADAGTPLPPQLRASVTQLQQRIADDKASLRSAGSTVAEAPEDTAALPPAPTSAAGLVPYRTSSGGTPDAGASDPYAQYRAYLLRLLPPLDAHAQPYLGLQTFQFEHADRFFGRDRLVAELAERLGQAPFLAVLGASGSGKSSVVRAGLLPLLKAGGLPGSERWQYVTLRPGAQPLDALVAALSAARGSSMTEALGLAAQLAANAGALLLLARMFAPRLVLVVDQAEELWTLQPSDPEQRTLWQEQQQRPFLRLLLSALDVPDRPLLVILALRTDFLHRASDDPVFASAIADHDVIVSPMTGEELRAAITLPAEQVGGAFEPGLVDELITETEGQSGALPLLEYTLQELWAQRQPGGLMTWACYRALGGVEGALAKRADSILQQHYDAAQRDQVRRVLLRLIQPGEGTADTRRRIALADLAAADQPAEALQLLLQPLIDARLLSSGQDQQATIEVAHEALLRSWPTFRGWIDEARADLRLQIQLEEAAKEWEASNWHTSLLWDGLRLSTAEAWVQRTQPHLNARDTAFLEASRMEASRQAHASARALRDRRLLAVALPLLIVAVIASVVAIISQRQIAAANELIDAQRLAYAAQTQSTQGAEVALLLASEAATRGVNPITEQTLRDTLERYPFRATSFQGHPDKVTSAAFSPDGSRIVTTSWDGTARVWSIEGKLLATLQDHTVHAVSAAFSPDGSRIVTASWDGTARVWNAEGKLLATLQGHRSRVMSAAFSPDGSRIVTASWDGTARVWNAEGKPLVTLQGHRSRVMSAAFSPDSSRIVTTSDDKTGRIWSIEGKLLVTLQGHAGVVMGAAFSLDGTRIVTTSNDGSARVWTVEGRPLAILQGHTGAVIGAAFSPDGSRIVTTSAVLSIDGTRIVNDLDDRTAQVWSMQGKLLATLQGHTAEVLSAAFSPDGSRIVTASWDGTARVWSVEGKLLATLQGHTEAVMSAVFSPDSSRIVTISQDGTARVWSMEDRVFATFQGHTGAVGGVMFSSDGSRIITTLAMFSSDGSHIVATPNDTVAHVWSVEGKLLAILQGHTAQVASAAFSRDGTRIVTASSDSTARVWSVEGKPLVTLQGHTRAVMSAVFSPDGSRIVTISQDGTTRVWSVEGKLLATLQDDTNWMTSAAFSPDGTRITTASDDKTVRVWSIEGQLLATLQGHTGTVMSAAFSPDGTRIITASGDRTARVWSVEGQPLAILQGHAGQVMSAIFSPDGMRIITTSDDKTVRVWSVEGQPLAILQGHTSLVRSAAFSPDGTRIVTTSDDGTARVWSVEGQALATLQRYTGGVLSAVFSPDGLHILTVARDGTARIYPLRTDDLLAVAACRLPRNLTPDEIARFDLSTPHFDRTKYQCPPAIQP